MSKVSVKKNNPIMTDDEYVISGKEIKENISKNEKISNEFKMLENLYQDALFDMKVLEKKNDIYSTKYQELKNRIEELTSQLIQRKRDDEHRKKIDGGGMKIDIKVDRDRAQKNADERFKKEGDKIMDDFMKQFN
jgi:hypothetical protein